MSHSINLEVRDALDELQQYLSDQLAPLMVVDSIETLLRQPPTVAASGIHHWASVQIHGAGASLPFADYLYHAMRKLHLLGEFKLIPPDQLKRYLEMLADIVVQAVPPEEQEKLRMGLSALGSSQASVSPAALNLVHRPGANLQAPPGLETMTAGGAQFSEDAARGLRRFTLLLERLGQSAFVPTVPGTVTGVVAGGGPPTDRDAILSQILTTAASSSRTSADLNGFLARLREMGLGAQSHEIFRALARSLPGWVLPAPPGDAAAAAGASPVEAMHKIVSMSQDPSEAAMRFSEMIRVAIERFNEGALAQAVQMFGLAEQIIAEKRIDAAVIQRIRDLSHEKLAEERLGEYADKPEKHALLLPILRFFPALSPKGLFEVLGDEPKRERRKLLISLLEVHGTAARSEAFETLSSRGEQVHFYLQRNLLHILRRVPRTDDTPMDAELDLLATYSRPRRVPIVAREAVAVLAQTKHERAESILLQRLREFEQALLTPGGTGVDPVELCATLDRIVAALARGGGSAAIGTVVDHALSRQAPFGDTMSRLAELASRDLSSEPKALDKLFAALKDELPMKVLGFALPKSSEAAVQIINALASTPAPNVRYHLDMVLQRFPDGPLAEAATKAIAASGTPARPPETTTTVLSGDLELFGLPNLVQTLADTRVTGTLNLLDPASRPLGQMVLESGLLVECQTGALRAEVAFYQLFEKPSPGTFTVKTRRTGASEGSDQRPKYELMPLVLESVRRHDEYRAACALVPDGMTFQTGSAKPTRPEDENDKELLRSLWGKVSNGASALECEVSATVDAYRVRRILAHWLEEGAVAPRQGDAPQGAPTTASHAPV